MTKPSTIQLVECPRDAMQGWKNLIPTTKKVAYLQALLRVGFDVLDCGSYVSPKAIPQMADTREVIEQLPLTGMATRLLVIVANLRGAEEAVQSIKITYVGFPFSISETFQKRNTNAGIPESLQRLEEIQQCCQGNAKEMVVYLSMAFGNPYGDDYNQQLLLNYAGEMVHRGIKTISLADTVGLARPEQISAALNTLIPAYPTVQFGVHLHSTPVNQEAKMRAAINAGCLRFDGALKGIGGCPMADDTLVGNMDTEWMINYLQQQNMRLNIDVNALRMASQMADEVFI